VALAIVPGIVSVTARHVHADHPAHAPADLLVQCLLARVGWLLLLCWLTQLPLLTDAESRRIGREYSCNCWRFDREPGPERGPGSCRFWPRRHPAEWSQRLVAAPGRNPGCFGTSGVRFPPTPLIWPSRPEPHSSARAGSANAYSCSKGDTHAGPTNVDERTKEGDLAAEPGLSRKQCGASGYWGS
jgi:hypothetical protein